MSQEASEKTDQTTSEAPEAAIVNETGDGAPVEDKSEAIAALEAEVARLQGELAEARDQFMRKAADMENFRKRLLRDKEDALLFANKTLLTDLVPVLDDFERAIKSSEQARDYDTLHNGIAMIEQQMVSMLEKKYGLKRMESTGAEFNPEYHEAIMMEDREDHETAMVLEDYQKGYTLNDKVLRTAKVKVSRPAKA